MLLLSILQEKRTQSNSWNPSCILFDSHPHDDVKLGRVLRFNLFCLFVWEYVKRTLKFIDVILGLERPV
jgi:hypothetical protein